MRSECACSREDNQNTTGKIGAILKSLDQRRTHRSARNNGNHGAQLQHPVTPGKPFLFEDFRQNAVFGGTEKRALHRHQEQRHPEHGDAVQCQRRRTHQHHAHFPVLGKQSNPLFAKPVSQESRIRGKHQERQIKDQECNGSSRVSRVFCHQREQKNNNHLEGVIVKRALKLG
jgi:hypothetical protein